MRTNIQKWGNSLALRIPKPFAEEMHLAENTPVELSIVDGKVVISPLDMSVPTLEELVASITKDNRHGEWDTGRPVGKEIID